METSKARPRGARVPQAGGAAPPGGLQLEHGDALGRRGAAPDSWDGAPVRGGWGRRVGRLAAIGLVLMVLAGLGAGAILFINQGPLPETWRAAVEKGLSEGLGAPVTVGAVRLVGPGRFVLQDVGAELQPSPANDAPAQRSASFSVEQVTVGFSLWDLGRLVREPLEAIRWVRVEGLEATVPAEWLAQQLGTRPSGDRAPAAGPLPGAAAGDGVETTSGEPDRRVALELADGRLTIAVGAEQVELALGGFAAVEGEQLRLHGLRTELPGLSVAWHGSVWPEPDIHARVSATDLTAAAGALPPAWLYGLPVALAGQTDGELWLLGSWAAPRAWGGVDLTGLVIDPGPVAQRPYALSGGTLQWSYRPERGLELALDAARGATRLRVEGTVSADGGLNLGVTATDLDLPADVAALGRWGAAGRADFFGRLVGPWREPELTGDLMADGGHLFDQPFTAFKAQLRLSAKELAFTPAWIAQGLSEYYLEGRVGFGQGPEQPGDLDLVLRTDWGRVEALASAIGWDVPVEAGFSGTLVFSGPLGGVSGHGDVVLTQGVAWGQPFDRLSGRFHYGPDGFQIPSATGTVRGGTVQVQGGGLPQGPWELAVVAEEVPVQAVAGLRDRLPVVSGLLSFEGTVARTAGEPLPDLDGRMTARHLRVGPLDFVEAAGSVELSRGTLRTDGWTLRRASGGTYEAAGVVRDVASDPQLSLDIGVYGESLADVLALTGLRLPVLAPSGRVAAEVSLQGPPGRPEARIRLASPDVYVIGHRTAVAVELRIQDGRIHVEELSRAG